MFGKIEKVNVVRTEDGTVWDVGAIFQSEPSNTYVCDRMDVNGNYVSAFIDGEDIVEVLA